MKYPHSGTSTYNGGGKVIAFAEDGGGAFGRGTIFCSGHDYDPEGGQMNLRVPVPGGTLGALPSMTAAQGGTAGIDMYGGKWNSQIPSSIAMFQGGLFPRDDGKLLVSQYIGYDGQYLGTYSHFVSEQDFTPGPPTVSDGIAIDCPGLGISGGQGGWYGQTMCKIPEPWQGPLGGNMICTGYGMSVAGRTSYGPDAIIVDCDQFGVVNPVPGQRLLGYPAAHATLFDVAPNDEIYITEWNWGSQQYNGVVFPEGTSTICYFAGHGYGPPTFAVEERPGTGIFIGDPLRYGNGTNNPGPGGANAAGTVYSYNPTTFAIDYNIYDPANLSRGYKGYPYRQQVWLYDVRDLLRVKAGEIEYWEVRPYYSGVFGNVTAPFQTNGARIYGATYDPTRRIIYLSAQSTDGGYPLIHAYSVPY